jgi:cytosine/adenosine deaminase-related metal-dependent hydrolase
MNNAVGRTPLSLLGPRVALGTDGIGGDMFEESRLAQLRHREERSGPAASDDVEGGGPGAAWHLERLAEGARFAGRSFGEPALGRISAGAPADLVVLDYPAPTPLTGDTLAAHWLFGLSARAVRDVMVGGRVVVRDRRLTTVDGEELAAEARTEAGRLWERLETIGAHPFAPGEVMVG